MFAFSGFRFTLSQAIDNWKTGVSHCLLDCLVLLQRTKTLIVGHSFSLRVGPWLMKNVNL